MAATAPARATRRFVAIGTSWEIETAAPLSGEAHAAVDACIAGFDAEWSRFRSDSIVSVLASQGGSVRLPADAAVMLDAYTALSDATSGAVNPLIGDALAQRGYDVTLSLRDRGAVAAPADWRSRLTWDDRSLTLRGAATIDVGAIGKGRLVDLVAEVLTPYAGPDLVVDASGDLIARGAPVRVGLEHPYDPRRAIGVWEIADAALCASAVNRRAWGDGLHHVLDARTGEPVRTIAATWAVAPTAMAADAIATALFFAGGEVIARDWGVEWVRMTTEGRVEWSPGSKAELFV